MNNELGLDLISCLIFRPGLFVESLTLICQQHFILAPSLFFIFIPPARSLLLLLSLSPPFLFSSVLPGKSKQLYSSLPGWMVLWGYLVRDHRGKKRRIFIFYFSRKAEPFRCQLDEEGGSTCRLGQGAVRWCVVLNQAASILCWPRRCPGGAESNSVQPSTAREQSVGLWCWI